MNRLRLLALSAAAMGYGMAGLTPGLNEDVLAAWVDRAALWVRERTLDPRWGAWAESWLTEYESSGRVSEPEAVRVTVMPAASGVRAVAAGGKR